MFPRNSQEASKLLELARPCNRSCNHAVFDLLGEEQKVEVGMAPERFPGNSDSASESHKSYHVNNSLGTPKSASPTLEVRYS